MEKILEVKDLHIHFNAFAGAVRAIRGVNFHLNKGETLAIVGESGSGKSVTTKAVTRILPDNAVIDSGEIYYKGQDLLKLSEKEFTNIRGSQISLIFQDPLSALDPVMKIGKQIMETLILKQKMPKEQAKQTALELMKAVGIPNAEKRFYEYPFQFSGGMRQRIVIAIALACNPELLICDEPTTALDVTIQSQILELIKKIQKEKNLSVIFITHDLGVVAELCDRVVVLYGGLVMEEASIFDIFEHPSHPYTLGLLASIPALDQDKSRRLLPIPGSPPDMTKPPLGCPFAPRCPYARVICGQSLPEMRALSKDHKSRCWLLEPDAPSEHNPFSREEGTKNE